MKGIKSNISRDREIFAKNFSRLMQKHNISQIDIADHFGWSQTSVSSWARGEKFPRIDKIQQLADYFHVSRRELLEDAESAFELNPRTVRVPVVGTISCGAPILADQNIEGYILETPDYYNGASQSFYVIAKGTSMEPTITDGSKVKIRIQPTVENGEIAAVLLGDNNEVTLKRFKREMDRIYLIPDNPKHRTIIIDSKETVRILGKAVKLEKDL